VRRTTSSKVVRDRQLVPGAKVAVAGATGRLGRHLVELLDARGHDVVPISRADGVDLISGEGLAGALAGVDSIVDASNAPSSGQTAATRFFTTAVRHLQTFGARAGVRRLVVVSIIGCDRFVAGYYAAKRAHEQAALEGPVPAGVVRISQFHELMESLLERRRVRRMRTQPVAARSAAAALVEAEPAEIAGPQEERLADLVAVLAAKRGLPSDIEEVSDPADPDREAYEGGALLPGSGALLAGPTFAEWLDR
jgi:uncharacterized protein YbjT (DUF2867 family)